MTEDRRQLIRSVRRLAVLGFVVTLAATGAVSYMLTTGQASPGLIPCAAVLLAVCGTYVWLFRFLTRRLRRG